MSQLMLRILRDDRIYHNYRHSVIFHQATSSRSKKNHTVEELIQSYRSISGCEWVSQKMAMVILCVDHKAMARYREQGRVSYTTRGNKNYYLKKSIEKLKGEL